MTIRSYANTHVHVTWQLATLNVILDEKRTYYETKVYPQFLNHVDKQ